MKTTTLLTVFAATAAALAGAMEKRQIVPFAALLDKQKPPPGCLPPGAELIADSIVSALMSKSKAVKIEGVRPRLRKDAKRVRLTYGPYLLKPYKSPGEHGNSWSFDPYGTGYQYNVNRDFPKGITILDAATLVADERMRPIDITSGIVNHHTEFHTWRSFPNFVGCPGDANSAADRPTTIFIGGATDIPPFRYTSNDGKFNSGYYLGRNDLVTMMVDATNYNNDTKTIYTLTEIEYVPGRILGAVGAVQDIIDLGRCPGELGLALPPANQSQFTIQGNPMEISADGHIINMRSQLHDGAVNMIVKLNDKEICNSKALYGGSQHEGHTLDGFKWITIANTTTCDTAVAIKKGDKLTTEAFYDLDAHAPIESIDKWDVKDLASLLITIAKPS